MSVNLTPQKTAVSRQPVGKTDTFPQGETVTLGKTVRGGTAQIKEK